MGDRAIAPLSPLPPLGYTSAYRIGLNNVYSIIFYYIPQGSANNTGNE